jgi:hypothetical protein
MIAPAAQEHAGILRWQLQSSPTFTSLRFQLGTSRPKALRVVTVLRSQFVISNGKGDADG